MQLPELTDVMYEMANFYPSRTGIGYAIFFGEVGGQHGPRIKVSNVPGKFAREDNFTVSVSKNPEVQTPASVKVKQWVLKQVFDWVVLNYDDLMLLWQIHETGDYIQQDGSVLSDLDVIKRLKKI